MPMFCRDVVVVGASAGGVEALRSFVAGLPEEVPAAIVVVLHLPAGGTSVLPMILSRAGPVPAVAATDGTELLPGRIFVAPPDHHVLLAGQRLRLSNGPTENGHRPAVDVLFRSAAESLGPRVVGVVLSGVLDDGAAGLVTIASRGGVTMVQDPADALYRGMPENALRLVRADHVLPSGKMGPVIAELALEAVEPEAAPPVSDLLRLEVDFAERALWLALRTLEEKGNLSRRMLGELRETASPARRVRYENTIRECEHAIEVLRAMRLAGLPASEPRAMTHRDR